MALSADEQRLLDQLEESLRAEDPGLARKFEVDQEAPLPTARRPWWALGVGIPVGIALLALGMFWLWPLSVLGFLVMFAAVIFVAWRPSPPAAHAASPKPDHPLGGWPW